LQPLHAVDAIDYMTTKMIYQPHYGASHALIVGINEYTHARRLRHARNDAEAFAEVLVDRCGFSKARITLLTDSTATRGGILRAFLNFAQATIVGDDDRLIVFFAGHGHTASGRRGETGFLVPVDGDMDDLSTLIRWDEMTRNADLIRAKHMFFIMDACYGGLALTRSPLRAGSMRLLSDMLQRFSRQVLTAGKGDEVVSDANGPRAGHSIFTGHLLDAIDGGAASEGLLTASGVMAYVHQKVANDQYSEQTPHYGYLDGDGDFIFYAPAERATSDDREGPTDVPIRVVTSVSTTASTTNEIAESLKKLLAAPPPQIGLDDFVSSQVRQALAATHLERFPVQNVHPTKEEFASRVTRYEAAISDVTTTATLMGRWSTPEQLPILEKILVRMAEADKGSSGITLWLNLGWYPTLYVMYAAGVAAISADNYKILARVLTVAVHTSSHDASDRNPLTVAVIRELTNVVDAFKWLPGHERHYVPRSEHLRARQQGLLEDLLFLGRSYDRYFDRFEILLALTYADLTDRHWGPPGRFAWKHSGHRHQSPYTELLEEARQMKDEWPILQAGLFRRSFARFLEIAEAYQRSLDSLNWW
jgi:hypothetical protein